jgi:hypothetical protein
MPLPAAHPSGDKGSSLLVWLIVFALAFAALALSAGSLQQRRSHFWVRVLLALVAMPLVVAAVVIAVGLVGGLPDGAAAALLALLVFIFVPAPFFVPALLYRASGSSPGSCEDDGGGWGPGPDPPLSPPETPRGGLPRPGAEQARIRVRDHTGPEFDRAKPRRPAREPERTLAPLP